MTKYYETDKFKKLNKKWQEKLKKSGFCDAEEDIDPTKTISGAPKTKDKLKVWSISFFKSNYPTVRYRAVETYYRLASQFLYEYSFKSHLEQNIWEHHSNGLSRIKIDTLLNKKIGTARRTIEKLSKIMLEKYRASTENDITE